MQIRLIRLIRRWEKEGVQHEESCSCCSTLIMLFDKGRGADAGSGGGRFFVGWLYEPEARITWTC